MAIRNRSSGRGRKDALHHEESTTKWADEGRGVQGIAEIDSPLSDLHPTGGAVCVAGSGGARDDEVSGPGSSGMEISLGTCSWRFVTRSDRMLHANVQGDGMSVRDC